MMMAHADGGEWVTARPGATLEEKRLLSAGFTNVVPNLTFEHDGKLFFPPSGELGASLAPTPNTPDLGLCGARAPARGKTHDGHDALAHQERNAQVRRARL
jgi:hypothetical protein